MHASSAEPGRRARVQALAERLYRERYDYLLRIATKNAAKRGDAEEAVSEALASFIRAFDPDCDAPPLAWLTLALKRQCWATYRRVQLDRRHRHEVVSDPGDAGVSVDSICSDLPGSEQLLEAAECCSEARRLLAQLKPAERRALLLIAAGYSYVEIGAINGWTFTKVNRSLAEGRARLRQLRSG